MKLMKVAILLVFSIIVVACAQTPSKEAKKIKKGDINCATAKEDIKTLEKERKKIHDQRVRAGVDTVVPVAAVLNILKGEWVSKSKVFSGAYVEAMDKRIKEIKETCNIK
jgi:hypothetical protein